MPPSFPPPEIPEPRLMLPALSSDISLTLGLAIRTHFLETYPTACEPDGPGIVIQIKLFSGHVLFACAVGYGGVVGPGNWDWVEGKFRTVRKSGGSSWGLREKLQKMGRASAEVGYPFPEYAVAGGGVPIWMKGNEAGPIGAIIVSGLPQQEDHQLIHNAIFTRSKDLVEPPSDPRYITA